MQAIVRVILGQRAVAVAQGIFYFVTGVWPLVHMRSFEAVTGPKTDRWLVKTAGVLITVVGAVVALAGARRRVTPEVRLLAVGSALGLTSIDVVYVARRRITPVYLLDAVAELALVGWWAAAGSGTQNATGGNAKPRSH
ncbi:MAG: hypothetical protein RLZZ387_3464 [Chloroflexota bacterium]|jgi:hypothetical protein